MSMLHGWENFFVTAAQSGAALIGLLFVSVTVGTGFSTAKMVKGTKAFLTPTLIHFAGVLFLSMAMLAPWSTPWPLGAILGLAGLLGIVYQGVVVGERRDMELVKMSWAEWIPYVVIPVVGNGTLIAGSMTLFANKSFAPFIIAAGIVTLLLSGILGAWDLTLWLARNRNG